VRAGDTFDQIYGREFLLKKRETFEVEIPAVIQKNSRLFVLICMLLILRFNPSKDEEMRERLLKKVPFFIRYHATKEHEKKFVDGLNE
jgi:hypothetical protein